MMAHKTLHRPKGAKKRQKKEKKCEPNLRKSWKNDKSIVKEYERWSKQTTQTNDAKMKGTTKKRIVVKSIQTIYIYTKVWCKSNSGRFVEMRVMIEWIVEEEKKNTNKPTWACVFTCIWTRTKERETEQAIYEANQNHFQLRTKHIYARQVIWAHLFPTFFLDINGNFK